jgi:two-component sensor histidine kinase
MKHLHELLYKQNQLSFLDTPAYFELLLEEIKQSYQDENISIQMNIQAQLQIEQAIYCGIILNELITNAFKYAFPHKKGTITIELFINEEGVYTLLVSDDGIGYTPTKTKNSLGLTLVNALAKSQLKGNLVVDSQDGVHVRIQWSKKNL